MTDWKRQFYSTYYTHFGRQLSVADYKAFIPYGRFIIRKCFPDNKSINVLDLGCGIGGFIKVFQENGYEFSQGYDASTDNIVFAKANGICTVEEKDAMDAFNQIKSESFDIVLFLDVLEHFNREEVIALLKETWRVLKPTGSVIIHVPNSEGIFGSKIRYSDITHELAFTESSLTQLTRYTGFKRYLCFEDKPIIHGIFSLIRRILWEITASGFRFLHLIETGSHRIRLTQNILFQAFKN